MTPPQQTSDRMSTTTAIARPRQQQQPQQPQAVAAQQPQSLQQFLFQYRVERGHEYTHTSLGRPTGSFYLASSSHDAFLSVYKAAFERGEDLYLTERHRHIGPVVVDLDFRFEPAADELAAMSPSAVVAAASSQAPPQQQLRRRHSGVAEEVVRVYCRAMAALVETPREFDVYVTEKRAPSAFKGLVKDGMHIVAPGVVTRPAIQLLLRRDVLPALADVFRPLSLANRIEDVVDEAVIERNNWMMYGSKKPGGEAYAVTRRYRYCAETGSLAACPLDADVDYVDLFSIRNKYDELRVRGPQQERADAFIAKLDDDRRRREAVNAVLASSPNVRANVCDDLETVRKLVDVLDVSRVESYDDWVRLGWCLRNIDHRLLETWVEASKRSSKYVDGECPRLWNSMRVGGLGVGTLHMWARTDAPERYRELLRIDLVALIKGSVNATHYDVARVVHHLYRYEYVCCNIRNRTWYEFKMHRWRECDSAYSLRKRLSTDVFKEYMAVVTLVAQRARSPLLGAAYPTSPSPEPQAWHQQPQMQQHMQQMSMASDDDDGSAVAQQQREEMQKACAEQIKKLSDLALKLKVTKFKDDVLKECAELFYHERFEDRLNSDINLLGFENGVYDLAGDEFREGRPDDYVSFSTGINYVPYVEDHPVVRDIVRFWESVHPDRDIREYVLMTLSSCLSGVIREERFHIWTGSGCHAAGTRVLLRDGRAVAVEEVEVGDELLGDDGRSGRRVERLCRGHGAMFRVLPARGESFVVNGDHVLSLLVSDAAAAAADFDEADASFSVRWLVRASSPPRLYAERTAKFRTREAAAAAAAALIRDGVAPSADDEGWPYSDAGAMVLREGDVIDATVSAYLAHLAAASDKVVASVAATDAHLRLYRPAAVDFGKDHPCNSSPDVRDAAYAMGLLMLDGGDCVDVSRRRLLWTFGEARRGGRATRCALLAGVLDAAGHSAGSPHVLRFAEATAVDDVVSLARSLGIECHRVGRSVVDFGATPTTYVESIRSEGRGDGDGGVPWRTKSRTTTFPWLLRSFMIEPVRDDDFFGFELDAATNRRYLMADYTATHNSNGKSLSVSLFEKSLGQYCCKFPVTLLTQKRAASNTATPEIARAKGRRFAVLQEPSEDERLNVGQLKELSGGDTVQTRELFKAPCEWRPQFKLFLLCNQLPHVPSDDGGTWRRIRVVEFGSKFVDHPNPERSNEFPIDLELSGKIEGWKEHFMALLLQYYRRYVTRSLEEPDAVVRCTRDYQRTNDHMADYVDTCIEKVEKRPVDGDDEPQQQQQVQKPDAFLALDDAFAELKEWIRADQVPIKLPKKNALQKYLDRALLRSTQVKGRIGYRGYRIRDRFGGGGGGGGDDEEEDADGI